MDTRKTQLWEKMKSVMNVNLMVGVNEKKEFERLKELIPCNQK